MVYDSMEDELAALRAEVARYQLAEAIAAPLFVRWSDLNLRLHADVRIDSYPIRLVTTERDTGRDERLELWPTTQERMHLEGGVYRVVMAVVKVNPSGF